jgi:hypothetical protein
MRSACKIARSWRASGKSIRRQFGDAWLPIGDRSRTACAARAAGRLTDLVDCPALGSRPNRCPVAGRIPQSGPRSRDVRKYGILLKLAPISPIGKSHRGPRSQASELTSVPAPRPIVRRTAVAGDPSWRPSYSI